MKAQRALRGGVHGHDEDTRRITIQPVYYQRTVMDCVDTRLQAVCQLCTFSGNRQKAGWLVQNQQIAVLVNDIKAGVCRRTVNLPRHDLRKASQAHADATSTKMMLRRPIDGIVTPPSNMAPYRAGDMALAKIITAVATALIAPKCCTP